MPTVQGILLQKKKSISKLCDVNVNESNQNGHEKKKMNESLNEMANNQMNNLYCQCILSIHKCVIPVNAI